MLSAEELFADGKHVHVPLHFSSLKQHPPVSVSGKAQKSSSRWRKILGLKKSSPNSYNQPADSSLNLPLLKDSDNYEQIPASSSSRLSLSSSSSSHEHEDLPRLLLDSEKPSLSPNPFAPCRMRIVKPKPGAGPDTNNQTASDGGTRTSDSPRMNSSGKIMFQSLERSSSSPSSGARFKQRGVMERSYSTNVVTPVLNVVPLRGSSKSASVFGFFSSSSPQKCGNGGSSKGYQSHSRSKNLV